MGRLRIGCVVGARPNFVKIAPIMRACEKRAEEIEPVLVHTGQHFDPNLSEIFFRELGIRRPDHNLDVGPGTPAHQTAMIIERFDDLCATAGFDRVLVVGDVTSTFGAAVTAAQRRIPVDHVEAGLRSFDRSMREEINRILTDAVAERFFVTEPAGVRNLLDEGKPRERIHLVGNVMIDSLIYCLPEAALRDAAATIGITSREYGVVTLHRPSNVDDPQKLAHILNVLGAVTSVLPLVFPVHPRTRGQPVDWCRFPDLMISEPLGYLDFLSLMSRASLVITDSGGIQEETTALRIPCLTVRDNTERPITIDEGSNTLVGDSIDAIRPHVEDVLAGRYKSGTVPQLWDGHTSERIVDILIGGELAADSGSCRSEA